MDFIKLGTMNINDANGLQDKLAQQEIHIKLDHNEATCTRGCTVTVEVWAKETEVQFVHDYLGNEYAKMLDGHKIDINQLNAVYDSNAEFVQCPACGHRFRPDISNECPDCGLAF